MGQQESAKPWPLGHKNGAKTPSPGQLFLTLFSMGYFKNTTVWGGGALWPPLVTLLFPKVERQHLVALGILMCFLQKWHQYDVIIGSLQSLCNFDVSECINSKFSDMGYFDLFFQTCYLFSNSRLV